MKLPIIRPLANKSPKIPKVPKREIAEFVRKAKRQNRSLPSGLNNRRQEMRGLVILNTVSNREVGQTIPSETVYQGKLSRADALEFNAPLTQQSLQRFQKRLRHATPKNQVIIVMAHSAVARRFGDRLHKFRKAYVIPTIDEFFDLLFHNDILPNEA